MNRREKARALVREYMESLAIAIVLALIIRFFVFTAYKIPTASMFPTLQVGDFVFAYKLPYGFRFPFIEDKWFASKTPDRGDVVVFRYSNSEGVSFIKRVVGVPGDRIEIRKKRLLINSELAQYSQDPHVQTSEGNPFLILNESILGSQRSVMISTADSRESFGPEVVPPGFVFVMGDNRDSSDDSRYWGMIPLKNIDGKILTIWLSLDWQSQPGEIPQIRWNRLLATVR